MKRKRMSVYEITMNLALMVLPCPVHSIWNKGSQIVTHMLKFASHLGVGLINTTNAFVYFMHGLLGFFFS